MRRGAAAHAAPQAPRRDRRHRRSLVRYPATRRAGRAAGPAWGAARQGLLDRLRELGKPHLLARGALIDLQEPELGANHAPAVVPRFVGRTNEVASVGPRTEHDVRRRVLRRTSLSDCARGRWQSRQSSAQTLALLPCAIAASASIRGIACTNTGPSLLSCTLDPFCAELRLTMSNEDNDPFPLPWRPHPSSRFGALRPALSAIEDAIAHQSDQRTLRAQAELNRQRSSRDDMFQELSVLHKDTEELLAKVFRGGFMISVWSLFESSIKELSEYVQMERRLPFGLQDLRANDFLAQTDKFFRATLNIVPFPNREERKQLDLLKSFRNALVHHDGSIASVPKELMTATDLVHCFDDYHGHEFAVPSAKYARESLELIAGVTESLADRVLTLLDPQGGAA